MLKPSEVFLTKEEEKELNDLVAPTGLKNPYTEQQGRLDDPSYEGNKKTQKEEKKMGYNAQNAKEEPSLPPDTIFTGVIINIADGTVKDFVKKNLEKWDNANQTAIEISFEVMHNEKKYNTKELITYVSDNGVTKYSTKSKLGKYRSKYGKLPEAGDQVKLMTNGEGFLRLKLD